MRHLGFLNGKRTAPESAAASQDRTPLLLPRDEHGRGRGRAKDRLCRAVPCRAARSCYATLHRTAPCYIILYYPTLHYTIPDYATLHYTVLYYTTLHYATLHCTILHCTTLHYYTVLHYTLLHCAILHCATLHCAAPRRAAHSRGAGPHRAGWWRATPSCSAALCSLRRPPQ